MIAWEIFHYYLCCKSMRQLWKAGWDKDFSSLHLNYPDYICQPLTISVLFLLEMIGSHTNSCSFSTTCTHNRRQYSKMQSIYHTVLTIGIWSGRLVQFPLQGSELLLGSTAGVRKNRGNINPVSAMLCGYIFEYQLSQRPWVKTWKTALYLEWILALESDL